MIRAERHIRIIDYLKLNKTAKLVDLARLNEVSVDTVRRDIEQLDKSGMLKRVHGGATLNNDDSTLKILEKIENPQKDEKNEMVQLVGAMVVDGQAIALNAGSTNIEVAKYLVENYYRLTILTNSLKILEIMTKAKNFTVIVPGGIVYPKEDAIFGETCEQNIMNYNIDVAILDVNAISIEKGITDVSADHGGIIKAMIKTSKQRVIVAGHSKFNKVLYMNICNLSEINYIITDPKLPEELCLAFEEKKIRIIMPHEQRASE